MCNIKNKVGLDIGAATYKIRNENSLEFHVFSMTDTLINFKMYWLKNGNLKLQAIYSDEIIFLVLKKTS